MQDSPQRTIKSLRASSSESGISVADPEMVYDPKSQVMVRPGTDDPVFYYYTKLNTVRRMANTEWHRW